MSMGLTLHFLACSGPFVERARVRNDQFSLRGRRLSNFWTRFRWGMRKRGSTYTIACLAPTQKILTVLQSSVEGVKSLYSAGFAVELRFHSCTFAARLYHDCS